MKKFRLWKLLFVLIFASIALCFIPSFLEGQKISNKQDSVPELKEEVPELATYMETLQTYVHKLSLSIDAKNQALAVFYANEANLLLEDIQEKIPVYEDIPVALYIDRMGKEPFEQLIAVLKEKEPDYEKINHAMDSTINSCNLCHASSLLPQIRIKRNSFNPYMQDFTKR